MLFSSVTFILFFLPAALLLYYIVPGKCKNTVLLLESLIFYAFGNMRYLLLAICLVFVNYLFARGMGRKSCQQRTRRFYLIMALVADISLLAAFYHSLHFTYHLLYIICY